MGDLNESERSFLNEFTRTLLVKWADATLRTGAVGDIQESDEPYFSHAVSKGWVSKSTPRRVTSGGFSTAASFLRR